MKFGPDVSASSSNDTAERLASCLGDVAGVVTDQYRDGFKHPSVNGASQFDRQEKLHGVKSYQHFR